MLHISLYWQLAHLQPLSMTPPDLINVSMSLGKPKQKYCFVRKTSFQICCLMAAVHLLMPHILLVWTYSSTRSCHATNDAPPSSPPQAYLYAITHMEPCSHMVSSFYTSCHMEPCSHMVSSFYISCHMESYIHKHPSQHTLQASPNAIINHNPPTHLCCSAHTDPSPCQGSDPTCHQG